MKTKMQKFGLIALIAFITALGLNINAQVPPSGGGSGGGGSVGVPTSLPIGSVGEAQARAWERVVQVDMNSWADSAIRANTNDVSHVMTNYVPGKGGFVNVEDVLDLVRGQQMVLSVLYPSSRVNLNSWLYDKDWNLLFYANSSSPIKPAVDGVSENTLDLTFEIYDRVFVPFNDVSWYYIVERNERGQAIRYWYPGEYDIRNGGFSYPLYFASKNGEVVITRKDGTQVAYGTGNGGHIIKTTRTNVSVGKVSVFGLRTVQGNIVYIGVTPEEINRNIAPVAQFLFETPKDLDWAYFASWIDRADGTREYANVVHIWRQGQTASDGLTVDITDSSHSVPVKLAPTYYWVQYDYPSGFGRVRNQFYPPYQDNGGGKGKGVAVEVAPAEMAPVLSE